MAFLRLLAAFVAVVCVAPAAWAAGVYHWCYMQYGVVGDAAGGEVTRYYTGFVAAPVNDETAIYNDFRDHLEANYDVAGNPLGDCLFGANRSDALRSFNQDIGRNRRQGIRIVRTGWTWSGRDLRGASASWREHTIFAVQSADVVAPRKRKPRPADESETETADKETEVKQTKYVACYALVRAERHYRDRTSRWLTVYTTVKPSVIDAETTAEDADYIFRLHLEEVHGSGISVFTIANGGCVIATSPIKARAMVARVVRETGADREGSTKKTGCDHPDWLNF